MSKEEFIQLLQSHDWYYHFSDDHSVWLRGIAEEKQLLAIARSSVEFAKMYDDAWAKHFTGKDFSHNSRANAPMILEGIYNADDLS